MQTQRVVINFKGGIISPGYLKEILEVAQQARVSNVSFGLRQQLIMDVPLKHFDELYQSYQSKKISAFKVKEALPNVVSSYPAAGIFNSETWLREGVYKDIFDLFQYTPQLKINLCDSQQSFVPHYTGHINWLSSSSEHFWHLYIRFPKTNKLYKWKDLVYTNDLATVSKKVENEIFSDKFLFYGNENADGNLLYQRVQSTTAYVNKPSVEDTTLNFSLPYYEGFNKANNQLWLGIYRRDELFPVNFLLDVCTICLHMKIGQLYATPWKSIIIKNIDPADRRLWDSILGKYRINVRHAANELNWQVEDFSEEGLQLKRQVIRHFDKEDVRTYGLCFAVRTKPTSSMFGTVIIQKQHTRNPHRLKSLERYDILYRKSFNPNEGETIIFRDGVEKEHLGIYLVSLCKFFYEQNDNTTIIAKETSRNDIPAGRIVYQCKHCYTVYDPRVGDKEQNIAAGTDFEKLPDLYYCPLCEAPKIQFREIVETALINDRFVNGH